MFKKNDIINIKPKIKINNKFSIDPFQYTQF